MSELIKISLEQPIRLKLLIDEPILLGAKQNGLAMGADGKNAYQIAVDNGFVGTVEEWIVSLKGIDGNDGKSSYQSYLETTEDDPPMSESDWANLYKTKADKSSTESFACGHLVIITDRSDSSVKLLDKSTGNLMFEINKYGQINSYGTTNMYPFSSGAVNTYRNGKLRIQQTTVGGHFQLNMWNDNDVLMARIDTNGDSFFYGGKVKFGKPIIVEKNTLLTQLVDGAIERDEETGKLFFTNGNERTELGSSAVEKRHLFSAPYDYCGIAPSGTSEDVAKWKITRLTIGETIDKTVLDGVKWSDLLTLNFDL